MSPLIYQWIDLAWLPVALVAVHRGHRILAAAFVLICVFTLRLQLELMDSIGYGHGIMGLMKASLYSRGLVCYGMVIGLLLILARFSPGSMKVVFLGASLTVYLFAAMLTMIVMLL